MTPHAEIQQINESMQAVGAQIREYRDNTNARLTQVEQIMARQQTMGGSFAPAFCDTAGSAIRAQLEESPGLRQLADSGRGATVSAHLTDRPMAAIIGNGGHVGGGSGSIASDPERSGIVAQPFRLLTLLDVLPSRSTERDAVEHVRIVSTGDAATQSEEGAEKAEIDLDSILVRAEIVTIAGHTTASRQVLSDHAALQSVIDGLLRGKVRQALESQVINGTGVGSNIEGLAVAAATFTPAGSPSFADGIGELLVEMEGDGFAPGLIVANPLDWHAQIGVQRDSEQRYMFGSPTAPVAPSLWNRPAVLTPGLAAGSVLVLDTAFITVLDRMQLQVLLSEHHKDNFTRNLITILAELRAGLEVRHDRAVRRWQFSAVPPSTPPSSSAPPASS